MKKTIFTLLTAGLMGAAGLFLLTATSGCGSTYSPNDSDRPHNEPRGFQHQGASRLDR